MISNNDIAHQTTRMLANKRGGIVYPEISFTWWVSRLDEAELERDMPVPPTPFSVCIIQEGTTPDNTRVALAVGKRPDELKWFIANITQRPPLDVKTATNVLSRLERTLSMIYHNYFSMWDRTLLVHSE